MNIIEEEFQNKEEKKKKTSMTIILVAIVFVFCMIIGIISYLTYIKNSELKVFLNGQANEKVKDLLVIEDNGTVYVPIKEIASYLGYESYNGEYGNKSEELSKCYVESESEIANFSLGSNKIYKLDLTKESENYWYMYSKDPIKAINGVLYATSEAAEKAFDISFDYDKDKNRIYIYTTPYLVQTYSSKVLDFGYKEISDKYVNQTAIAQNDFLVVKSEKEKYGVVTTEGDAVLEVKYDDIEYLPTTGDFLVKSNEKYGIVSKTKETKVQLIYDSIELMDSDSQLYVVSKDKKYGVIDFSGKTKIYIENDEIGVDSSKFSQNEIKNNYILADNLIPVRKGKVWGLYNKNGNQVVDFKYDSFGYIASNNKDAINLLVIPDYNVLVACKDKKYTLLNSSGEELFAPVADDIYMNINGGQKYYYIMVNNKQMNAIEFLDSIGVKNNNKQDSKESSNNTNTNETNTNKTNQDKNNSNSTKNNQSSQEQSDEEQNSEEENQDEEQNNNDESQDNNSEEE